MGLRQMPNGRWMVDYSVNGRRIRRVFHDKQRAKGILDGLNAIKDTSKEEEIYMEVAKMMEDTG